MIIPGDIPKYVTPPKGTGRMVNPEYLALMEPYFEEGMHAKGIAEIFGVHADTVRKHFPGRGWTLKQRQELGTTMKHFNRAMKKATYV